MSFAKKAALAFVGILGASWSVADACYFTYRREARTEVRETRPVGGPAPVVEDRVVEHRTVERRPVAGPPPAAEFRDDGDLGRGRRPAFRSVSERFPANYGTRIEEKSQSRPGFPRM